MILWLMFLLCLQDSVEALAELERLDSVLNSYQVPTELNFYFFNP